MKKRIQLMSEDKQEEKKEEKKKEEHSVFFLPPEKEEKEPMRLIGLYGDLDEEKGAEIVYSLMALNHGGVKEQPKLVELSEEEIKELNEDPENPMITHKESEETETIIEPIDFLISTYGGSAADMFAIYDTMKDILCPVHTKGMGKVMSAGTLLLAAGEKGKRSIGKNCRVMIHAVIGGHHGPLHNVKNELEEIDWVQERYIECLAEETEMSVKKIKEMIDSKQNVYLSAEQAVELGIADIIV